MYGESGRFCMESPAPLRWRGEGPGWLIAPFDWPVPAITTYSLSPSTKNKRSASFLNLSRPDAPRAQNTSIPGLDCGHHGEPPVSACPKLLLQLMCLCQRTQLKMPRPLYCAAFRALLQPDSPYKIDRTLHTNQTGLSVRFARTGASHLCAFRL